MGIASAPHPDATINQVVTLKILTNASFNDVVPGGGAGTIYGVDVDCKLNTGEDVHVRFADAVTGTAGTTKPEVQLLGKKSKLTTYIFKRGIPLATGISAWCAQEASYTSNTAPTGTVNVTLLIKDS